MKSILAVLLLGIWLPQSLYATNNPYHGQENRAIKSLSDQDVDSIQKGKGWGLAKPAELNGYPGPIHVLDMAQALALSPDQLTEIQSLFETMQTEAVMAGKKYLERESSLDLSFSQNTINAGSLRKLVDESLQARADLRYIHLSTHLSVKKILSKHQIAIYQRLRGYSSHSNHQQH